MWMKAAAKLSFRLHCYCMAIPRPPTFEGT
jgi:hypothetical protein